MRRLLLVICLILLTVASVAVAKPKNAVKELVGQRTANSKTWRNADGSLTAEISSGICHYKDKDGNWQDIDTSFQKGLDGKHHWSVVKNPLKVYVGKSSQLSTANLVTTADSSLDAITLEADGASLSFFYETAAYPEPVVQGNRQSYSDVWPGVDLQYTVYPTELKEDIILKQPTSQTEFVCTVNHDGLDVEQKQDGSIAFYGSDGTECFCVPAPYMYDASGRRSDAVSMSLRSNSDGATSICIVPDQNWLAQAQYPVVIDPSFSVITYAGSQMKPCFFEQTSEADPNDSFHVMGTWHVHNTTEIYPASGSIYNKTAYLGWVMPFSIPVVVDSASISLLNQTGAGSVSMRRLTSLLGDKTDDRSGIIYDIPSVDSNVELFSGYWASPLGSESVALRDAVSGWIDGKYPNYGIQIRGTSGGLMTFGNGGDSYAPASCLNVTYHTYDEEPNPDVTAPGKPGTVEAALADNSTTISGTWGASTDSGSGVWRYLWAIGTAPGMDNVSSWTPVLHSTGVRAGSKTGLTLASGVSYYFSVKAQDRAGNCSDVAFASVQRATGNIIYVEHTPGGHVQSYTTISAALTTAVAGDQIWVAAGNYNERVTTKPGVAIYGGFAPFTGNDGQDLAGRDREAQITTIDGGNIASYTVYASGTAGAVRVIDGFHITNGATGVFCSNCCLVVSNNHITGNTNGGVRCWTNSSVLISDNIIDSNISTAAAGGVYCSGCNATIKDNTITNNTNAAGNYGGIGLFSGGTRTLVVSGNTITGNSCAVTTGTAGSGILCSYANAEITNNWIQNNTAATLAGGVTCIGNTSSLKTLVANNVITSNTTTGSGGGQVVVSGIPQDVVYGRGAYLINNTIVGQTDNNANSCIYCTGATSPDIFNNIMASADYGVNNVGTGYPSGKMNLCGTGCAMVGAPGITDSVPGSPNFLDLPNVPPYHLKYDSPCIDNGFDGVARPNWKDIDAESRSTNVTGGSSSVDIGADESQDRSEPTVAITCPSNGAIHKAPGQSSIQLIGTATDDTRVVRIQVAFSDVSVDVEPSIMNDVNSYDAATGVWTYIWSNPPLTQRIWIKATDSAGRTKSLHQDLSVSVLSNVKYVRPGGMGDGSSWGNAEDKIGDALTMATSGSEVWVAKGTYQERISIPAGIAVYGGFAPTEAYEETYREQRNAKANETVLDGQYLDFVVQMEAETARSVLDGFTVIGGSMGGVKCSGSGFATISNNIVRGNRGSNGGVYCSGDGSVSICDNIIADNSGSGIHCWSGTPVISRNAIVGNSSEYGGGIFCEQGTPTIANNVVRCNSASRYGAGIQLGLALDWAVYGAVVCNNIIADNDSASDNGGGIYVDTLSSATISNNTIVDNLAADGGGLYILGASVTVANNIIAYNSTGIIDSGENTRFSCNDVFNNPGDVDGVQWRPSIGDGSGNICADPSFVSIAHGELHLASGSSCINAGNNSDVVVGYGDMDGRERIFNDAVAKVDIGADEYDGTTYAIPTNVVYVKKGCAAKTGKDWSEALDNIQFAIDTAAAAGGGEVWVAGGSGDQGTYKERVSLRRGVSIYGGFSGTGDARDSRSTPTTIDGSGLAGSGLAGSVVTARNIPEPCVIEGFTITGGSAENGGGIYCEAASVRISRNVVTGNRVDSRNETHGAGICVSQGDVDIVSNVIKDNTATSSGALAYGGGIYFGSGEGSIVNNTVARNICSQGGGMSFAGTTVDVMVANNIIAYNAHEGVYCDSHSGTPTVDPTYRNNYYYGNAKDYYGDDPRYADIRATRDPGFACVEIGNLHLMSGSPCIDNGDDSIASGSKDVDGNERKNATVDIGAYEWNGVDPAIPVVPVVRVKPNAQDDSGDGGSWETAKKTIQGAIDAVRLRGGGQVWVAQGDYNEAISIPMCVGVYGGFSTSTTHLGDRNLSASQTTIHCPDSAPGGVSTVSASTSCGATIDGFRITGVVDSFTPAVRCNESAIRIASCIVQNNAGDGIYVNDCSSEIVNNVISDNCGDGVRVDSGYVELINNTITHNIRDANYYGVRLYRCDGDIENNIVAFNGSCEVSVDQVGTSKDHLLFRCNDVYDDNGTLYGGLVAPTGTFANISVDPDFVPDDPLYHLQAASTPCRDNGANEAVELDTNCRDIDSQSRIMDGVVDIGADEVPGCPYMFVLKPEKLGAKVNDPLRLNAYLYDTSARIKVPNQTIDVAIDDGTPANTAGVILDIAPGSNPAVAGRGTSGPDGNVSIDITRDSSGSVSVTASTTAPDGSVCTATRSVRFGQPTDPADVVFVIDCSNSMQGHSACYGDGSSVEACVREVCQARPDTRFGAILWSDSISSSRSISEFGSVDAFCSWVNQGCAGGTEAQIAALNQAAADLEEHSPQTHRQFVVFVTDEGMQDKSLKVSRLALAQRLDALTAACGGVFVSLWEDPTDLTLYRWYSGWFTDDPSYFSLAVNGGFDSVNDPPVEGEPLYVFDKLKDTIINGYSD